MSKNVSNAFKNVIKEGGPFYAYASVLLSDGSSQTMTSETDFSQTGNSYSEDGETGFPLGSALSKSITLNVEATSIREDVDYYKARITLYTEADLPDGTTERIQEGIFTVIDSVTPGEILEITAYDDMYKADVSFTSLLTYPVSAQMLLNEVCSQCGITLGSASFRNNDFQIQQAPVGLTGRQVIGYIAQIAGGNAVIDSNARLIIKTYDLSGFNQSENVSADEIETESGIHIISQYVNDPDIGTDDVTITGVTVEIESEESDDTETYTSGTEEYALRIDNPLIAGNEKEAVDLIADVVVGITIRPFSGTFMPNPTIEFMDLVYLVDKKDNQYKTFITTHDFEYLSNSTLSNSTESPERHGGSYYSTAAEVYQKSKKDLKNNRTQWEQAIENLSQQVANASGLYTTEEEQPDGSTIFYMHNKPTLEESDIVWQMTAETLTVSTDGGKTWNAGITVNGEVITRIMNTIGINFDWGVGGTLILQDDDGNVTAYMDANTGEVRLTVTSLSIQGKNVNEIASDEIEEFIDTVYEPEIESLKNQIDQKSETWYQSTDPSLEWDETEESPLMDVNGNNILDVSEETIQTIWEKEKTIHEGDLWKDSATNIEYIYQSGEWIEMPLPDDVFDLIDGKAQIFVSTPVPPYDVGDLWFNGSSSDIMTCVNRRDSGAYVSSDWQKRNKYTDDTVANEAKDAVETLDSSLDQEEVFNRLTNKGEEQGLYIYDGKLYVNGTYMRIGKVSSANGQVYFDLDNNELACSRLVGNPLLNLIVEINPEVQTGEYNGDLWVYNKGYEGSRIALLPGYQGEPRIMGSSSLYISGRSNRDTYVQIRDTSSNSAAAGLAQVQINAEPYGGTTGVKGRIVAYQNGNVEIERYVEISGSLDVTSTKARIIETDNYGIRRQYCYEMPSPMFGDVGEATTDEDGECIIYLDDIFSETVSAQIEYQVFLQKEGQGDVWIHEKSESYFIVKGTKNLKFAWEIKIKQKDYECERLEEKIDIYTTDEIMPEAMYQDELDQLIQEQEEVLYETA